MASTANGPESGADTSSATSQSGAATGVIGQLKSQTSRLADLGISKAAEFADGQRQSGVETADTVAEIIREFADAIGDKFGAPAGGVVNRGGDAVAAFARGLEDRSVEDLVEQGRSSIVRHPGAAIAAASVVGFVAGRIVKGGLTRPDHRNRSKAGSKEFAA